MRRWPKPGDRAGTWLYEDDQLVSAMAAGIGLAGGLAIKGTYRPEIRENDMGGAELTRPVLGTGLGQGLPAQVLAVARVAGNVAQKAAIRDRRSVGLIGPGRCLPGHQAENHDQLQRFIDRISHDTRPSLQHEQQPALYDGAFMHRHGVNNTWLRIDRE